MIGLGLESKGAQSRDDHILQISLTSINYIENIRGMPKRGGPGIAIADGAGPGGVTVVIGIKLLVSEVAPKQPELPQLIGDVFANVGNWYRWNAR